MGFESDISTPLGFALDVDSPGADLTETRALNAARSWAGLTEGGRILVSVEQLTKGLDAASIVAHESVHDELMHTSAAGLVQLALSVCASPVWPRGIMRRESRRVLGTFVAACLRTHECCATMIPSLSLSGTARASYWAHVPGSYRDQTQALTWVADLDLPAESARRLVLGLGAYALGTPPPLSALIDPRGIRQFLALPANHPDQRFDQALRVLRGLPAGELRTAAEAEDPGGELAKLISPTVADGSTYVPTPPFPDWAYLWQEQMWGLVSLWRADPRTTAEERAALPETPEMCLLLLQPRTPTELKTVLTQTVSTSMVRLAGPEVEQLAAYPLCKLSWNGGSTDLPGFASVEGRELDITIAPEECAAWLFSPDAPLAGAILTKDTLTGYLGAVPEDVTICVTDSYYFFPRGDVIASEPILHGRRHLVVIEHHSLGALLMSPLLSMGLAEETSLEITAWFGKMPDVSYVLFRPAVARSPIVVVPVPSPTARGALQNLDFFSHGGLTWTHIEGDKFLKDDALASVDVIRFCMWFEDQPWPPVLAGPRSPVATTARQAPPAPHAAQLSLGPPPDSRGCRGADDSARLPADTRAKLDSIAALEGRGRLRAAERKYLKMMAKGNDTDRAVAAIALASLKQKQGKIEESELALRLAATSPSPDMRPLAMDHLGALLAATSRPMEAAEVFLAATRTRHPEYAPTAALNLAYLLLPADDQVSQELFQWVADSGHPDAAPLAKTHLQ